MQAQPSITPTLTAEQQLTRQKLVLEGRARNGANWFFWIGGLSIINTIVYMFGGAWSFIVGLGTTQLVDAIATAMIEEYAPNAAMLVRLLAVAIDIGLAGIFIVAGLLSRKKYRWALITGMVLYFLDALLFIWVGDWLGLIFHVLALVGLWTGLRAMNSLKKLAATQPGAIPTTPVAQELTWFRSDVLRILGGSCAAYIGVLVLLAVIGFALTR